MGSFCRFYVLLFLSVNLHAQVFYIDVEEFNRTNMEYVIEIVDRDYKEIRLDCQSFINMISIKKFDGNNHNFILELGQCPEIFRNIQSNITNNLSSCLITDFSNTKIEVLPDYCP